MTIFTQPRVRKTFLEEIEAPLADSLLTSAEEALLFSPTSSIRRIVELDNARHGEPISLGGIETGEGVTRRPTSDTVSAEDARARIKEEAVDLSVPDTGIRQEALDILISRKKEEKRRRDVLARAPSGALPAAARFGAALAASALDPLNVAASFIPVVGPARYAMMLERAGSTAARVGVRARVGALEGAVGAAVVEPIVLAAATQEQADYDITDSLLNIALGTALGGGLHIGVGALSGDFARGARPRAAEELPLLLEQVDPGTREAALRTSVAQLADGRNVDVVPLLAMSRAEFMGSAAPLFRGLDEQGDLTVNAPSPRELVPPQTDAQQAGHLVASRGRTEDARVHKTQESAEKAARRAAQRRGENLEVVETPDGFVLGRREQFDVLRNRDGNARLFKTERSAQKLIKGLRGAEANELAVVPVRQPGEPMQFAIVEGASEDALRSMRANPEAVRFAETPRPPQADISALLGAARRSFDPENIRLTDFSASRQADERLASAPRVDQQFADDSLSDILEDVTTLSRALGDETMSARELAEFDALITTADEYGRAVRAAASCQLRRT